MNLGDLKAGDKFCFYKTYYKNTEDEHTDVYYGYVLAELHIDEDVVPVRMGASRINPNKERRAFCDGGEFLRLKFLSKTEKVMCQTYEEYLNLHEGKR